MALQKWVEFFDELQHVRGRSKNTVLAYRRDLELYDKFTDEYKDLRFIYDFLKNQGLSTRSQARVISSVRTYFRYLESQGIDAPELRSLRPPKVKAGLPKAITVEEFEKLYQSCSGSDTLHTARNQITLLLLYGLGARVTELISLNLSDLNQTDSWVSVTGKAGKQRLVPLTEQLLRELVVYLKEVRPHLVKEATSSMLINDRGNRPSRVDIWRWLKAWSERAGFSQTVSPHRFRHGCATALLEGGADLRSIQMLLGHSSIQTTQIYTSVSSKRLKEEVQAHHPLSALNDLD